MTKSHLTRRTALAGFAAALVALAAGLSPFSLVSAEAQQAKDPNIVVLTTKDGPVTIRLRPDLAPKHVAQIKALVQKGFYDGLLFHRVIPGFMAQTGDPKGNGTGGSDLPNIPAEFTRKASFKRGTVGMARSSDPNSANSQFFICLGDASFLDGNYTIIGEVVSGMENVDKIKAGTQANNGAVSNPDKIVRMRMGS